MISKRIINFICYIDNKLNKYFKCDKYPLLGPNIFLLSLIGIRLFKVPNSMKILTFIPVFEIIQSVMMIISLFTMDDKSLREILENLHITFITTMCIVKLVSFFIVRKKLAAFVAEISQWELRVLKNGNSKTIGIMKNYVIYGRIINIFYNTYVMSTGLYRPISIIISTYKEPIETRVYPELYKTWMPFDKTKLPAFYFAFAHDSLLSVFGPMCHTIWSTFVITSTIFFSGQLYVLQHKLVSMFDGETDEEHYTMFKECLDHHRFLIRVADEFNKIMSPIMFIQIFITSGAVCSIALQMSLGVNVMLSFQILLFTLMEFFIFYWHGNQVLYMSQDLVNHLYVSGWYLHPGKTRKLMPTFMIGLRRSIQFTAGPFFIINNATFLMIIKGVYSFYTLVKRTNNKHDN